MGKLAATNTKNQAVRSFARKLVEERTQAEKELAEIFARKGMRPESTLARNFQSSLNHLARLKGRAFDQAFKEQVIEDQQTSIRLFQEQAEHGADPDLKAFAEKHLPQLRAQLALAERLDARTGDAQTDRESDGGTVNNVLRSLGTTPGGNIPR